MKKCSWCGAEYPDDLTLCPIDQNALASIAPPALPKPRSGFIAALLSVRDEPQMDQSFVTRNSSQEFRGMLINYLGGLFVGIFVYFAVLFTGIFLVVGMVSSSSEGLHEQFGMMAGLFGFTVLGGFLGVYIGTACLPRGKRAFASIVLLIADLALYLIGTIYSPFTVGRDNIPLIWIIPAAIGGMGAAIFFNWGRRPKFSPRPRAGQGTISKTSGNT